MNNNNNNWIFFKKFTFSIYCSPKSRWLKPPSSLLLSLLPACNENPANYIIYIILTGTQWEPIDQYYSSFLACGCNNLGTINNTIRCHQYTGACPCQPSIHGRYCDECKDGFYFFPITEATECLRCPCDLGGAYPRCNKVTGKDMSGPAAGCSLGIRDWRILHLLICRILWLTLDSLWLFFIQAWSLFQNIVV